MFEQYVEHGWKLVPLRPGVKGPTARGWNLEANCIGDPAAAAELGAAGLAHAYSGTCAVDVDNLTDATLYLGMRGIHLHHLLEATDAVQVVSGRENRAKLLYRLPEPLPSVKLANGTLELRCASRSGRTLQDVLPPSPHPSGTTYAWRGDWRALPALPEALLELWRSALGAAPDAENSEPIAAPDADLPALQALVADLDPDMPYDEWLAVGMALQDAAGDAGRDVWDEWSSGGEKYAGPADIEKHWRSFTPGGGITADYLYNRQTAAVDVFEDLGPLPVGEAPKLGKFEPIRVTDWVKRPAPKWALDGLLPERGLAMVYGSSGSGKSFWALDISMHRAAGLTWHGRTLTPAPVLWIAAEAAGSVRNRALAWGRAFGRLPGDLWIIGDTPSLRSPDHVRSLLEACAKIKPGQVVVDTLAAASGGANENSGEDMSVVLAACAVLQRVCKGLVILIHHTGKDASRGARGWSGMFANMDSVVEIRHADGQRLAVLEKQRDGESGFAESFVLDRIELDAEQSSCVVAEGDAWVDIVEVPFDAIEF